MAEAERPQRHALEVVKFYYQEHQRVIMDQPATEALYDLNNYPQDIRPIVKILLRHEERLSDGFIYYLPGYDIENDDNAGQCKILEAIAREIMAAVDKERPF